MPAAVRSVLAGHLGSVAVWVFVGAGDRGARKPLEAIEDERLFVRELGEGEGWAQAWNTCLREAKSEFVAMQAPDDVASPVRFERQREALVVDPELAVLFTRHSLLVGKRKLAPRDLGADREDCRRAVARMVAPAHIGTAMLRRSAAVRYEWDPALGDVGVLDLILRLGEELPMEVLRESLVSVRPVRVVPGRATDRLAEICARACERRELPGEHGAWFVETRERSVVGDPVSHFAKSCAEMIRSGNRLSALQSSIHCARLHPFEVRNYGPLVRTLLPRVLLDGLEEVERITPMAPVQAASWESADHGASDPLPLSKPLRLCLFGAAGDTGNLGVSALMHSTLAGIARFAPETSLTVFDNGWGERDAVALAAGREFFYRRIGARLSRRYHRPESFWNMRMSARTTAVFNPGLRAMREADAILDLSGGDSFADIYGERHLEAILAPKRLALSLGRPLVLMPQTYGPFRSTNSRAAAAEVLSGSRLAWARDERSFDAMKGLLGGAFDPKRHRVGVDVAFALERYAPRTPLPEPIAGWIEGGKKPIVGINVSGLLWNDPKAVEKYELRVDYRAFLSGLVRRFLETTEVRIVLVSHVIPTEVLSESDPRAARELRDSLTEQEAERVAVLPEGLDQSETKWVISNLDWFTGARMHATIGAISSGVPTAGLAYSIKIRGVFATCGVEHDVVDLRELETSAALEAAWRTFEERGASWEILHECVPAVRARALEEIHETLAVLSEDR